MPSLQASWKDADRRAERTAPEGLIRWAGRCKALLARYLPASRLPSSLLLAGVEGRCGLSPAAPGGTRARPRRAEPAQRALARGRMLGRGFHRDSPAIFVCSTRSLVRSRHRSVHGGIRDRGFAFPAAASRGFRPTRGPACLFADRFASVDRTVCTSRPIDADLWSSCAMSRITDPWAVPL
jgi:hypothetical protein